MRSAQETPPLFSAGACGDRVEGVAQARSGSRGLSRFVPVWLGLTLALATISAAPPRPHDLRSADALARSSSTPERDRRLAAWSRGAPLAEILYVLRRPASELGGAEARLLEAALVRAPVSRGPLRRRLALRLLLVDPVRGKRRLDALVLPPGGALPARPRASVFRLAALLPDSGNYEGSGRSLRLGIEAGLAWHARQAKLPLELAFWSTGDDQPARAAAALDSASQSCGVVVGELLGPSTAALATAARVLGLPLVSPGAAREELGSIGPMVFQVGPSALQRGWALARAVARPALRIGVLASSRDESASLAAAFGAAARDLGARILWQETYAPGNLDFRGATRVLRMNSVELLFWDGDPREAEALIRQLAQERLTVRLCGGAGLDPRFYHPVSRPLLEEARYVGEDWELPQGSRAVLDSVAEARGEPRGNPLHARGWLAARLVAAAVEAGALCPEELAASLATRVATDSLARGNRFFDWRQDEAHLGIYRVVRGRACAP